MLGQISIGSWLKSGCQNNYYCIFMESSRQGRRHGNLIVCNTRTSFGLWLEKERASTTEDKSLTKSTITS